MTQKELRLYTDFISLMVSIEFPHLRQRTKFKVLEQKFISQDIPTIIEILNKHNLIKLSNAFNYFIKFESIDERDYDGKVRNFEKAFAMFVSFQRIEGFITSEQQTKTTSKIEEPRFLGSSVVDSKKGSYNRAGSKWAKRQKKFNSNQQKTPKFRKPYKHKGRPWEKEKDYNLYGIKPRIMYTGMKN